MLLIQASNTNLEGCPSFTDQEVSGFSVQAWTTLSFPLRGSDTTRGLINGFLGGGTSTLLAVPCQNPEYSGNFCLSEALLIQNNRAQLRFFKL